MHILKHEHLGSQIITRIIQLLLGIKINVFRLLNELFAFENLDIPALLPFLIQLKTYFYRIEQLKIARYLFTQRVLLYQLILIVVIVDTP